MSTHVHIRIALAFGLLALAVVTVRVSAATWVSPSNPEPGGNIAQSLNTSDETQTKHGALTIQSGVLTVSGSVLTVGATPEEMSKICFINASGNADCRAGWGEIVTNPNALSLYPQPYDHGYVSLKAPSVDFGTSVNVTVRGIAGAPTSALSTFGVLGQASPSEGQSYGIQAQANVAGHIALYADTAPGTLWAGYFSGSVLITDPLGGKCTDNDKIECDSDQDCVDQSAGNTCIPYPSLIIGGNGPGDGLRKDLGYICLDGDCRSQWPSISGTGYWTGTTTLTPKAEYTGRSLAVGGAGSAAPVKVVVSTDADYNPVSAHMTVRGNAAFSQYVVGTPPGNASIITTCGDGKCTGLENDAIGSPYYCPSDCDSTPPSDVILQSYVIVYCPGDPYCTPEGDTCEQRVCRWTRTGEICDYRRYCPHYPNYTLYVRWQIPPDADYAGVKVIIRNDRYPNGPDDTDNVPAPISGFTAGPTDTSYDQDCTAHHDRSYYVGMYAFDSAGNYSQGLRYWGICSNADILWD